VSDMEVMALHALSDNYMDEGCATNPYFRRDDPNLSARLACAPGYETFLRLFDIT
jgi:hypothetical protein